LVSTLQKIMREHNGLALVGLLIILTIIALIASGMWYWSGSSKQNTNQLQLGAQGIADAQNLHNVFDTQNTELQKELQSN